jgi:acyl-CoA synthetase (AMP-forming)/AMP-acid ligase II/acyl carrier protein
MKETVFSLLADSFRRFPDAPAILTPGRRPMTYADLGRRLAQDHAFLRSMGLGPRSRIGVAMPAGAEGLTMILAAAASAVCAPLDPDLEAGLLERLMAVMRIDCLVAAEDSTTNALGAAQALGIPRVLLSASTEAPAGSHVLKADLHRAPAREEWPGPDDLAFLWHTSGTTGVPKIVPNEQWRICSASRTGATRRNISAADRMLMVVPLSSAALARIALRHLGVGASLIHAGALSGMSAFDIIEALSPTVLYAPPALLDRLVESAEMRGGIRHHLRAVYSSFAELPPTLRARVESVLGVPVAVVYGMSEAGAIAESPLPPERAPESSVGRPVADVRIADEQGNFLGRGQLGELWVRGPEVIAAYESPPEANRDAFRDGWFRTGDCGQIDEQGFLHLSGRVKDVINRGGVKVSPAEVEVVLASHPAVREAAVFARRHPTLGEDVCAAVVLETGRSASEAELRRFARQRLSAAKVPTRIFAAATLPRNAAGKLQRTELDALGEALLRRACEPPQGPHEEQVARIFRQVLRVEDIGRNDQFFDRGGDSLRAIEVLERIEEGLGVSLPIDVLLENSSVAGLARVISQLDRSA